MTPLCTWCGSDEYVEEYDAANDIAYCTGPGHSEPRMFEPKKEARARIAQNSTLNPLPDGIASELGLYHDLPLLLSHDEWAETGVVEFRYGTAHPDNYAWMLSRWGHVSQSSRRFSVTTFIGSTLGALTRATNVTHKSGRGTGLFSHNSQIGYWTLQPPNPDAIDMSWATCAARHGFEAREWPLLALER